MTETMTQRREAPRTASPAPRPTSESSSNHSLKGLDYSSGAAALASGPALTDAGLPVQRAEATPNTPVQRKEARHVQRDSSVQQKGTGQKRQAKPSKLVGPLQNQVNHLAALLDAGVVGIPKSGDKLSALVQISVPVQGVGLAMLKKLGGKMPSGATISGIFELSLECERLSGGDVKIRAQGGGGVRGELDGGVFSAFAQALVLGYIEAVGDNGYQAVQLMMDAAWYKLQATLGKLDAAYGPLVATGLINGDWASGAAARRSGEVAERLKNTRGEEDYFEYGMGARIEAGVGTSDNVLSNEGGMEAYRGTRVTSQGAGSSYNKKDKTVIQFTKKLTVKGIAGQFQFRWDSIEGSEMSLQVDIPGNGGAADAVMGHVLGFIGSINALIKDAKTKNPDKLLQLSTIGEAGVHAAMAPTLKKHTNVADSTYTARVKWTIPLGGGKWTTTGELDLVQGKEHNIGSGNKVAYNRSSRIAEHTPK